MFRRLNKREQRKGGGKKNVPEKSGIFVGRGGEGDRERSHGGRKYLGCDRGKVVKNFKIVGGDLKKKRAEGRELIKHPPRSQGIGKKRKRYSDAGGGGDHYCQF